MEEGKENSDDVTFIKMETTPPRKGDNITVKIFNSAAKSKTKKLVEKAMSLQRLRKNVKNDMDSLKELNDTCDFKEAPKLRKGKSRLKLKSCSSQEKSVSDDTPNSGAGDAQGHVKQEKNVSAAGASTQGETSRKTCEGSVCGSGEPAGSSVSGSQPSVPCVVCGTHLPESAHKDHQLTCLRHKFAKSSGSKGAPAGSVDKAGSVRCHVCGKDISHLSSHRQTQHINTCLDKEDEEKQAESHHRQQLEAARQAVLDCPMCGKKFKVKSSRQSHLKKCALTNQMTIDQLKSLMRQQEEEHHAKLDAGVLPVGFGAKKGSKLSKQSRLPSVLDEDTQLALALSTSLAEVESRQEALTTELDTAVIQGKSQGRGKKGKQTEAGSLLTSLSTEEARERISDRVERYIFSTASEVQDAPQLTPPFKTSGVGLSSGLSEPAASSAALSSQSSVLLSSSSSSKEPQKSSLWSKTSLGVTASQVSSQETLACSDNTAIQSEFYVRKLMPPVSVSRVVTGSKLKRVSAIAGRKTSLGQLGNMDLGEDEDGSPVASQTVDILAELAMESETADGEREADVESDLPGGDRSTQTETVPLTSTLQLDLTNSHSGKACGEDEVSDMEASGFCKEQPVTVNEAVSPGLSTSYLGLVNSSNLSDLSILADHGTEIPVHKQVLYARCPQLLETISVKSGREVIDLSGHTADSILCMLRYIYAGQVSILPSCVTDLRQLATRFSLHKLVDAVDKIVVPVDRQGDGDDAAAADDDAGDDGDNSGLESTGEEELGVDGEDEREASFDDNDWIEVFLTQRENMRKKTEVQATAEGHEEDDGEGVPGDGQKDERRCEETMGEASEAIKDLSYNGPLNQPFGAAGIRDSSVTHSAHVLHKEVRPRDVGDQLDMDTDWHQSGADIEQLGNTSHTDHQMDTVLTSVSHTHQQTHVTDAHSLQPLAEVTANCVTKPAGCTHPVVSSQEHKQHHNTVSVGDVNLDGNETKDIQTVILFAKEEVKEEDSKTVILFANEMVKKEEPEGDGREGELPCRWVGEGQAGVVGGDGAVTTGVSNLNTGTDQPTVTTPTTNGQNIDLKVTAQKDKPLTSSKKRRKRKKVSAKEFKQLVDKVVSEAPEVRSTMGEEPVSSLLTDEDIDRIIVKMEQDFQAITSASSDEPNDSFYIPSVLDRVEDDDDDVVITNSDIKIPALKRKPRQRRRPKSSPQEGSSGAVVIGTKCSTAELMKDQHGASGTQHISPALVGVSVTDKMLPGTSSSLLTDQEKPDASHPLVTLPHIATPHMAPPRMASLQKARHIALHQSPIAAGTPSSSSKLATSSTDLPTPPLSSSKSTLVSTSPVFSSAAAKLYSSDTSQAVTNSSTALPQRKTCSASRKSDSSTGVNPPDASLVLQSSMTEIHPSVERCLGASYPPNEECISGDELFSDEEESCSLSKPSTSVAVPTSLRRPSDASWSLSTMVISSSPLASRLDVCNTGVDRTRQLETSVRRNIFPCSDPFTKPASVSHQAESPHSTDKEDKSVSSAPTFTKIKHPPGSPGSKLQSCEPNSAHVTKPVGDVKSQGHRSQRSSSRPANQTPLEVRGNLVDIVSDLMLDYVLTSGHSKKRGEDRSLHQTDDSFVQDSCVGGSPDPAQAVDTGKAKEQNSPETSGTETDMEKGEAGRGQGSPLVKSPGLEKVASHLKMMRSSLGKSLNKALIAARSPPLADKSVASTDKNVTSADKNVTSADKNVTSADKNVTSADKNVTSTDKNVTSADKNVTSADKNVTSADKNVTSADKDVTSADKNVTSADKNVTSNDKNVTPADKNVTSADKDVTSADRNVTPTDKNVTSGSKSNKSSSRSSTPTASKKGNVTVSSDSLSKRSPQSLSTHSVSPRSGSPRGQSSNSERKRQPKNMSKPVCDDGNSDEGVYRSPMKTKRGLAKKRSLDSCGRQSPTASHNYDMVDLTCSQTPPHSPTHEADSSSSNVAGSEPSPSWQVKMCDRQETCQTSSPTQPAHGTHEVRTPSEHSHHSYTKCSDSFTAIPESPQVPSTSRDRSPVSLSDRRQARGQPSIHKSVACADKSQSSDEENLCGAGNYLGSNSCSPVTSMPEGNSQGEGGVAESQRTVGKTGHHAEKLGVENSQLMTDSPLPLRQRLARMFEEEVLAIVGQSRGDKKSDTDNSCLSADERKQQTAAVSPAMTQPAGDVLAADFANDDSDDAELCKMDVNNVGQQQQQHQKKQSSQNSSKETIGKTPNQKVGTKAGRKKITWKEPSPFTPMAPYDEMNTPQLKNAVAKIGAKPVGKKRMRELLKHVYHQTHQYETDSDYDGTPVKRGRTEISPSKLSFAAKLSHQPIGVTGTSKSANKQRAEGGKKTKTGKQKKTSSQTVPASQSGRGGVSTARSLVSTVSTSSGGETEGREQEESSGSHDTSFSDGEGGDCPEESILQGWPEEEEEGMAPTQLTQSSAASMTEKLVKFITDNKDIHEDILMYEPLELDIVKQRVADAGIRIGLAKVMDFLDERCITFTMKNMSSRNNNRRQLKGKPKASQRSPKKKKKAVQ